MAPMPIAGVTYVDSCEEKRLLGMVRQMTTTKKQARRDHLFDLHRRTDEIVPR